MFSLLTGEKELMLRKMEHRPKMSQLVGVRKQNLNKVHPMPNLFLSHHTVLLVLTVLSLLEYTPLPLFTQQAASAKGPICMQILYAWRLKEDFGVP